MLKNLHITSTLPSSQLHSQNHIKSFEIACRRPVYQLFRVRVMNRRLLARERLTGMLPVSGHEYRKMIL